MNRVRFTLTRSFKTRSAAKRWGREYEARIDEGKVGLISEAKQHKLDDAIKKYRAEFLRKLRSGTARKYAQHLDDRQPHLGHMRLSELTACHQSANATKRYARLSEQHTHAPVWGIADGLLGTAGGEG